MKAKLAALALILTAGSAQAATTGFSLLIEGPSNPFITLTNTGDMGEITGLVITIGDLGYNFDHVNSESVTSGSLGFSVNGLDIATNNGLRSDTVDYTFTSFGSGDAFRFRTDVDIDTVDSGFDLEANLLTGGMAEVTFSGGLFTTLTADLTPTNAVQVTNDNYLYAGTPAVAAIPLPAALPMVLVGLGALGWMRQCRRA